MSGTFSMDAIRTNLFDIFSKHAQNKSPVTDDSLITGDLGIDSLSVMEIVAELEDAYGVTFPDEDLPKVRTVGDVIGIVAKHLGEEGRLS